MGVFMQKDEKKPKFLLTSAKAGGKLEEISSSRTR
jgi:hypothetical protein